MPDLPPRRAPLADVPYPLVCGVLGLVLGWLPWLLHGPIPEKFDVYYIRGDVAIWAFYSARLLIGFFVGISVWPRRWWLRGPAVGFLTMAPVTFVSLATPSCGPNCMIVNLSTATLVGALVAAAARLLTGRE